MWHCVSCSVTCPQTSTQGEPPSSGPCCGATATTLQTGLADSTHSAVPQPLTLNPTQQHHSSTPIPAVHIRTHRRVECYH